MPGACSQVGYPESAEILIFDNNSSLCLNSRASSIVGGDGGGDSVTNVSGTCS